MKRKKTESNDEEEQGTKQDEDEDLLNVTPRLVLKGHRHWIHHCAFSGDGGRVVSGGWDKELRVWDAERGAALLSLKGHTARICCCSFFPDSPDGGMVMSCSKDRSLRLWDTRMDDPLICVIKNPSNRSIESCDMAREGRKIVFGGEDAALRLWDIRQTQQQEHEWRGHTACINACRFSPSSSSASSSSLLVASASSDSTVRLWRINEREEAGREGTKGEEMIKVVKHGGGVRACEFAEDGQRIASGGYDRQARIWLSSTKTSTAKQHEEEEEEKEKEQEERKESKKRCREEENEAKEEIMFSASHDGWIFSCCFSPGEEPSYLAVGVGNPDYNVHIWDTFTRA
ncbi:Scytalone dehydratase [Balamuthia mandrillaris]